MALVFGAARDDIRASATPLLSEPAMNIVGTVITEQGISFAVVQVHAYTVETEAEAEDAINSYSRLFPGLPVVLMAIAGGRSPTYWGRRDLANFLARLPPNRIPLRPLSFAKAS
jgi:hypothetical protein